jgi:hypothetical protein
MEQLYFIEEETTSGWVLVGPACRGLTKEKATEMWNELLAEGYNPNALRVVREQ